MGAAWSAGAPVSDNELAALAAAGDTGAFETLAGRYQSLMYGVCRRITCNDDDAVDALQESLIIMWQRIGSFEGRSAMGTWLFRIATNAAIDLVRRRAVRRADTLDERAPSRTPSPASDAEGAEVRGKLFAALAELPERQRVAVTLFDVEGYSHAEIAAVLRIPEGTVRSDVFHARRTLRVALAVYDPRAGVDGLEET